MSKRYQIFLIVLFCGFLLFFSAAHLLTPDREFSPQENRYLTQLPTLKLGSLSLSLWDFGKGGNLFNGLFMSQFESYITDQFVGRDNWIALKSWSERLLGKQENNGVYFGEQDTLIARFDRPDQDRVDSNLEYVNKLVSNVDIPVYFSLIPGKVSVWADRLPDGAPNADENAYLSQAQQSTSAIWADLSSALMSHRQEDLYYRTDHHWTSLGAYYGYAALMEAMGIQPVPLETYEKTTVSTEFYGTTYSSSGVRWVAPDSIDTYVPEDGIDVTSWFGAAPQEGELYVEDYLAEKDKYSFFLGGNQSLCVIKTQHTDAPKLLIVRDSYTDSLAPFLTAHFSEIHLVDPRYNKTSLSTYIQENGIDAAVVLYSVANFTTDANLFVLGS